MVGFGILRCPSRAPIILAVVVNAVEGAVAEPPRNTSVVRLRIGGSGEAAHRVNVEAINLQAAKNRRDSSKAAGAGRHDDVLDVRRLQDGILVLPLKVL